MTSVYANVLTSKSRGENPLPANKIKLKNAAGFQYIHIDFEELSF